MSFFHKKNVTKCLGHHYAIWTSDSNFLLAQQFFLGASHSWPSFQALHCLHDGTSSKFNQKYDVN
jgi:hypothetical protein